jgi:hypothetical protein
MASTKGIGSRRVRSLSSADAWICGAIAFAASMMEAVSRIDVAPAWLPHDANDRTVFGGKTVNCVSKWQK